jgi:hypothetical protein
MSYGSAAGGHGSRRRDASRYLVRAGCDRTLRCLPRRLDWSRSRNTRTRVANRGSESTLSQTEIQQCSRDLILGGSATGDSSSISRYETISSSARAARSFLAAEAQANFVAAGTGYPADASRIVARGVKSPSRRCNWVPPESSILVSGPEVACCQELSSLAVENSYR